MTAQPPTEEPVDDGYDEVKHRAAMLGLDDALQVLKEALQRSTKRSKLRQLEVVCSNQHRLIEVFPTRFGPLVIGQQRLLLSYPNTSMNGPFKQQSQERAVTMMLAGLPDQQEIAAQCSCSDRRVPIGWLRHQLKCQARRVVLPAA